MNADGAMLIHRELTERVIGVFYDVYNDLGAGFLEAVYENAMAVALHEAGLPLRQQVDIPVHFRGVVVGDYRADLIVDENLIVEIKAIANLAPVHEAQLLNYLKATGREVGLLLNFGPRPQFKRMILTKSPIRVDPRPSVARKHVR